MVLTRNQAQKITKQIPEESDYYLNKVQDFKFTDNSWRNRVYFEEYPMQVFEKYQDKDFIEQLYQHMGVADINWSLVSTCPDLSVEFLRLFKDKLNWRHVCENVMMDFRTLEEFIDKLDWIAVSKYQNLSETFMLKYFSKLNKDFICQYQTLSMWFMDQCYYDLVWSSIWQYQKYDENFIECHIDKIDNSWDYIALKDLSPEFRMKYKNQLDDAAF